MKIEAMLYKRSGGSIVSCYLCSHRCKIPDGGYGLCGVRQNIDGILFSHAYGEVIAENSDPIEKKPLYHFFPGSTAYSIATAGCNLKCSFCQNWQISQPPDDGRTIIAGHKLPPHEAVANAKRSGAVSISYTYTEPTIFFEYAHEIAKLAKEKGLYNNFVTNGYMTAQAIEAIAPYLDAANIDLKCFTEESYARICKGSLKPVCESIKNMRARGIWIEITTLLVPGLNDSDKELNDIAGFIAGTGVDIPWHVSRFHPDYQYTGVEATPMETLRKAHRIGKESGLRYVYLGNVAEEIDTRCYNCNELLIKRGPLYSVESRLDNGRCPKCATALDGVF